MPTSLRSQDEGSDSDVPELAKARPTACVESSAKMAEIPYFLRAFWKVMEDDLMILCWGEHV